MGSISRRTMGWAAALAFLVLGCSAVVGTPTAWAGVGGSKHDFYPTTGSTYVLAEGGNCSACHLPHFGKSDRLWTRDLSAEGTYYNQNYSPTYVPGGTLLCYDCHDDGVTIIDQDPPLEAWNWTPLKHPPQDIALGGTGIGYYENICGEIPPPVPAPGAPTGGHYWKSNPGLTPDYGPGDKIDCSLCHDPHNAVTGTNDVFFRTSTWDGDSFEPLNAATTSTDLRKSKNSRAPDGNDTRLSGRQMCANCHAYSGSAEAVRKTLFTIKVPRPPVTVPEHAEYPNEDTATACTDCHPHNRPVGCTECHAYPPMLSLTDYPAGFDPNDSVRKYVENYPGGAGAHRRHRDALGTAIFNCAMCHGANPGRASWHNETSGAQCGVVSPANVDIRGQIAYWGVGSSYNDDNTGGDAQHSFAAKGGAPQKCANLACHGNPPAAGAVVLNWGDDMVDETTGDVVGDGLSICKWCHDGSPATINGGTTYAPNVMGNGTTFGADVNGHGLANTSRYDRNSVGEATPAGALGAGKQCTVCHDARYTTNALPAVNAPVSGKTHFGAAANPREEKRLRDTINSQPIGSLSAFPTGPDQACSACHQNGSDADGADWSYHGIPAQPPPAGGYVPSEGDPVFTRACRQCHDVHGSNWNGAGRNLYMVGKWIDTNGDRTPNAGDGAYVDSNASTELAGITSGDRAVVFTSRTGADSFDENDGAYSAAADTDDVCATCHTAAVPGDGTGAGTAGGSHDGLANPFEQRGTDCTDCHDHDFDNDDTTTDAFMPSGCNGCHGNSTTKQFWPDGAGGIPAYADDNAGAHENHVQAISRRVFNQSIAQLLADTNMVDKQKHICRYCHPDPGGGGHNQDGGGNQRVDVLGAGAFGRFTLGPTEPQPPAAPTLDATSQAYNYGALVQPPTEGTCNNLVCHNQAATPFWNALIDWTSPVPPTNCSNTSCHATTTYTVAHAAHAVSRTEASGAGSGYACTQCHVDNYNLGDLRASLQHQNGEVDMLFTNAGSLGSADAYYDKEGTAAGPDTGFAYRNGLYAGTCNSVYCHGADSTWGGADTTPVWNSPATATCYGASTCHNAYGSPVDQYGTARNAITSGSHSIHITQWTTPAGTEVASPRGPRLAAHPNTLAGSTQPNCSACHNMLAPPRGSTGSCDACHFGTASGASLPTPTHADGRVDFIGVINAPDDITAASLAATTACDACHGGAIPAATAKTNWPTATRLACESCHGDYTAARSRPNIGFPPRASVDAPTRAGANFDGSGHGKAGVARGCQDCHAENSQHFTQRDGDGLVTIAPALGDTNRLDLQGGNDYGVAPVAYCGACHAAPVENVHFPNTRTAGGTSNDAILCSACHDPHGQAGQDAMIVGSVITDPQPPPRTISGFTDNTLRASYANATGTPYQGVCQACHDPAEVTNYFNRTTDGSLTHQPGSLCTSCHKHTNTVAFTAHCYDCHGDTATGTHFYPDTASALPTAWPDRAGKHVAHVNAIASFSPSDSLIATDASTCGYCHPGGTHSGDQAAAPADLMNGSATHFLTINGLTDADELVTQVVGPPSTVTCDNVNCHYNTAMAEGDWYGAPTVGCNYCHADGVAAYTPGDLPNAHNVHVDEGAGGGRDLDCTQCHPTQASNSHQNGTVEIVFSPTNTLGEPGTTLATQTGSDNAVKYGQTGGSLTYATCNALFCHGADTYEDAAGFQLAGGTLTAPNWAVLTDGDCGTCHDTGTQAGETSPGTSIASGNHAAHFTATYGPNFDESNLAASCDQCHPPYTTPAYRASHVDGAKDFLNLDNTTVTNLAATDTCNNCHGASTASAKTPANWANGSYLLPCIQCHDTTTPANSARAGTGVDAPGKVAADWTGRGHGNTTTYPWGINRTGANSACDDCHDPASAHLSGALADSDRLSTSGNALCNSCHDGPGAGVATTMVSTHGNRTTMANYTRQRNQFELNCVECHDVHGTANIFMIGTVNPDGPLVADRWYNNTQDDFTSLLFRGTVAFTDRSAGTSTTSGVGFADSTGGNATKICQTCHTATVHFQYDSTDTHFTSPCTGCHPHEFGAGNATADAFMPVGDCTSCHNTGEPLLAPKVMANWTTSGHGKFIFVPLGGSVARAVECTDCHDVGLPASPVTHLDTEVNSVWENGTVDTRNTNTAHLRSEYFPSGSPASDWDVQVTFDNFCWTGCHEVEGVADHRHSRDTVPAEWAVEFGSKLTRVDGDRGSGIWQPLWSDTSRDATDAPYPIDCDLNSAADCSDTDYAPCISCHDPHGTQVVLPGPPRPPAKSPNIMLRRVANPKGAMNQSSDLCRGCHQ